MLDTGSRIRNLIGSSKLETLLDPSVTSNVPRPLTRFIGREDEIQSITQILRRDDVRLLTLTGSGGIGKTRLSIEVASQFEAQSDWSVRFVTLAAVRNPDDALTRIASALGLWNSQPGEVIERLVNLIRHDRILLVLDNLEHVLEIASDLGRLLSGTESLTILATSRSPLHIQGEREYSVPQLTIPDSTRDLAPLPIMECEAVSLFVDRARAINHDFEITENNAAAIAGICIKLDGLPLAIELAAARTRTLPTSTLLARLDNQLGLLRSESRDLPERLRTIRATINWSYELLTIEEQAAFRKISIFSGDFPLSAAHSLLGLSEDETLDIIESLVDKSLLLSRKPFREEPHFRMLSVVRQFGLESLDSHEESHEVCLNHAQWAASFAEGIFPHQFGRNQREALGQIDRVHETIHQALVWSIDNQEWLLAARIAAHIWQYWDLFGYLSQGRKWLHTIILQNVQWPSELIPNLYYGFGILAGSPVDAHENRRIAEALMARIDGTSDVRLRAVALNLLGLSRDTDLALASAREAAEIWKLTGDTVWCGLATGLAGRWAREAGDLEMSDRYSRESLEILSEAGHVWGIALALLGIGRIHQLRGEIEEAMTLFQRGLTELQVIGDRILVLRYLEFIMYVKDHYGDLISAVRTAGAATRIRDTMGYQLRYKAEERTFNQFRERCRQKLGDERFNEEWSTGYQLSFQQAIEQAMVPPSSGPAVASAGGAKLSGLTPRERDVLQRIVQGKTDQAIADELFVSYRTVTTHVTNILNKLGANTRTEATAIAIRENLIDV
jgi:predicted ATPase/DNA-binding CsgD family transcriptional regulator